MAIKDLAEKLYKTYHESKGTFAHYIVWQDVSIWEKRLWYEVAEKAIKEVKDE